MSGPKAVTLNQGVVTRLCVVSFFSMKKEKI